MGIKHWIQALGHFGRLGRAATNRSFLIRERRKLYVKLGERAMELLKAGKLKSSELSRLVEQIEKLTRLIAKEDYGGDRGVDFFGRDQDRGKKSH